MPPLDRQPVHRKATSHLCLTFFIISLSLSRLFFSCQYFGLGSMCLPSTVSQSTGSPIFYYPKGADCYLTKCSGGPPPASYSLQVREEGIGLRFTRLFSPFYLFETAAPRTCTRARPPTHTRAHASPDEAFMRTP